MWSDNETERDFLNFSGVADTVAEIIVQAQGRPISIGVSGASAQAGGPIMSIHSRRSASAVLDGLQLHPGAGVPVLRGRLATWEEVDLGLKTWTVPASRMKAKRDHRVRLSVRTLEILYETGELAGGSGPGVQRQHYLQAAPGPGDRGRTARVPLVVPGLGGAMLRLAM